MVTETSVRKRTVRAATLAALGVVLALGLAGCGGAPASDTSGGQAASPDAPTAAQSHEAMSAGNIDFEEISYDEFAAAVAAFKDPGTSGYTKLSGVGHEHNMEVVEADGAAKLETSEVAIDETKAVSFDNGSMLLDGKATGTGAEGYLTGDGTMMDAILNLGLFKEENASSFKERQGQKGSSIKFCRKGDLVGICSVSQGFEFENDGVKMTPSGTFEQLHMYNSYGMLAYGRLSKGAAYEVSKDGQTLGTKPADFEFSITYE